MTLDRSIELVCKWAEDRAHIGLPLGREEEQEVYQAVDFLRKFYKDLKAGVKIKVDLQKEVKDECPAGGPHDWSDPSKNTIVSCHGCGKIKSSHDRFPKIEKI